MRVAGDLGRHQPHLAPIAPHLHVHHLGAVRAVVGDKEARHGRDVDARCATLCLASLRRRVGARRLHRSLALRLEAQQHVVREVCDLDRQPEPRRDRAVDNAQSDGQPAPPRERLVNAAAAGDVRKVTRAVVALEAELVVQDRVDALQRPEPARRIAREPRPVRLKQRLDLVGNLKQVLHLQARRRGPLKVCEPRCVCVLVPPFTSPRATLSASSSDSTYSQVGGWVREISELLHTRIGCLGGVALDLG